MKLVLAITGASGSIYPRLLIDFLKQKKDIELFVTATQNAHKVFLHETGTTLNDFYPKVMNENNFDVPYVSGSAKIDAMIILPCSMGMLGRIACGTSDDAISRTADVFLKERRKLILVPRETPLNLIHLRNMAHVTEAGALVLPATPHFYGNHKSIDDVANTVIARILDHVGIENRLSSRWQTE